MSVSAVGDMSVCVVWSVNVCEHTCVCVCQGEGGVATDPKATLNVLWLHI